MKTRFLLASVMILCSPLFSIGQTTTKNKPKVGSDRDAHGCIPSAGYTWSAIKKECIQVFKQDILLIELNPKKSYTTQVAVIFSKDKKKAEVFLPDNNGDGLILNYNAKTKTWRKGDIILSEKNGYEISKGKEVLFRKK